VIKLLLFASNNIRKEQTITMQYEYENYDPSFPDQPVVDQYLPVWARLPAFKSKPAFIWAEDYLNTISTTHLTYEQLNTSVDIISTQLLFPLQRGDTVLILCSPGLDLVKVIFGCQRAGLLTVPIVPPHPSFTNEKNYHRLIRIISQTKPKAAIAHPNYISTIQQYITSSHNKNKLAQMLQTLLWISTEDIKNNNINSNSNLYSYNGRKPDEVYLVQYTSGATGIPKPVLVTTGSAAHNVRTARKAYDLH
jgi:acyl-coenzyme A synthetase/AMP-(fatty) acid ligase